MQTVTVVENMLFSYPVIIAELRFVELEIERVKNDYNMVSGKIYENVPKVQTSSLKSSQVESIIINRESQLIELERSKRELEIAAGKIDSILKTLNETEYLLVEQFYFKNKGGKQTADILDVSENYVYKLKKKILYQKLCPIIKELNIQGV